MPSLALHSGLLSLVLVAPLLATGCLGYSPCGTYEYATPGRVDDRYDTDRDGDLDLIEACDHEYGSFGSRFAKERIISIIFDWSEWDTEKSTSIAWDYLPGAELYFIEEKLVKGAVLGLPDLGGYAFYKPGGGGDTEPLQQFPIREARLEILDGPVEQTDVTGTTIRWKFRWEFVFGNRALVARGEDWIKWDDALWFWDSAGHNGNPPGFPRP